MMVKNKRPPLREATFTYSPYPGGNSSPGQRFTDSCFLVLRLVT